MLALAAGNAAGLALTPYLLVEHPLVLVALAPELGLLVLIGDQVTTLEMLAIGVPRRVLGLAAAYLIGRGYGAPTLRWAEQRAPRMRPILGRLETGLRKLGAPLIAVVPSSAVTMVAGAVGVGPRSVAAASLGGSAVLVFALHHLGAALTAWMAAVKGFLAAHVVGATLTTVGLVVAHRLVTRRRTARQRPFDESGE